MTMSIIKNDRINNLVPHPLKVLNGFTYCPAKLRLVSDEPSLIDIVFFSVRFLILNWTWL